MAYTEFYCQSGGSNLNAGSTTNNTALYTVTNGGWNQGTNVYTPADGTNPVTAGVAVGMWASVYVDGASVGVYIGRITAVTNAANGTITVGATQIGASPTTSGTTRTIKVGGAWLGPNAASGFPVTLSQWGVNKDSTGHLARLNLKNDQTYSLTAAISASSSTAWVTQGYTSSVGDGGKSTFDGSTSTATIFSDTGASGNSYIDLIFKTSFTTGSSDLVALVRLQTFIRCVFTGARGSGVIGSVAGAVFIECEAYDNNKSNTASKAGFVCNNAYRCISHDNTGSNTIGFLSTQGPSILTNCVSDTNGKFGISVTSASQNGDQHIQNCDVYNNGSDGINIASGSANPIWIENTNLVKNTGAGINNASVISPGFIYNCGYGSGTQANGSADTINGLVQSGTVTYGSNLTPWADPANGDFRINLAAANFAGRAAFLQTAASYAGTVGYPDIGAAQSLTGSGGTFSKETSHSSAS